MEQNSLQRTRRVTNRQSSGPIAVKNYDTDSDMLDDRYDDVCPTRMPSSVRRYQSDVKMEVGRAAADEQLSQSSLSRVTAGQKSAVPPRRTASQAVTQASPMRKGSVDTEEIPARDTIFAGRLGIQKGLHVHWLVYLGSALLIMLLGWVILSVVADWWQVMQDDIHYGRPRTYQADQVVGHNDSLSNPSHFIALNLNRHVEIIEFPGGDSTKVKIYIGPVLIGPGQDLAPITLSFKDINGDQRLDMIVNIQGTHLLYINDNGQYRPLRNGENVQF